MSSIVDWRRPMSLVLVVVVGLLLGMVPVQPAAALEAFTVNSTDDQGDNNHGDGVCRTADSASECTLRAAVEEGNATGDAVRIVLPGGTYPLSSNTQIDVTNTSHPITIDGDAADNPVIDGNGTTRIFDIVPGANLSIDDVTLANGSGAQLNSDSDNDGGAVYNAGTFEATNSTFRDNTTPEDGAALENDGTMTITNSSLVDNDAGDESGAVDNDAEAVLTITGSVIENNSAEAQGGGAIENEGDLTIDSTVFRGNRAEDDGGAIENNLEGEGNPTLTIVGSLFEQNSTLDEGGAIDIDGGTVEISGTTFLGNRSDNDGGGAINSDDDAKTTIVDSVFEGNVAGDPASSSIERLAGGAIENQDGATLDVDGSTFRGNSARDDGGAIALNEASGEVTIASSTMSGNDAPGEGGAFWSDSGLTEMTNVTISGNTSGEGAGIYLGVAGGMTLSHVTIARNVADVGGGIDKDAQPVTVAHTLLAQNEPTNCSGDSLNSDGHNVTDDASCVLVGGSGDVTDVDEAGISDLGDYGGDTEVHALLIESPAIDVSESGDSDEGCEDATGATLDEDQRDAPRPIDGDDSGVAFCDAGAYEYARPDSLTLTPGSATNPVGTQHTVTSTVVDPFDAPAESITVRFSVSGANTGAGSDVTGGDGRSTFTYTGSNLGDDTITAFADVNGDGTRQSDEPQGTATKTWQEPPATWRLWGADRFLTAIAVSQDSYGDGAAGAVVLARDDVFADALAGTPLAVAEDAPLLLTQTGQLRGEVAEEIERVAPAGSTVYLLGGEEALSETVADQVADLGYEVERVYGVDRFATAVQIAGELGHPDTLMVTTGFDFVDALTAGPAAVAADAAILLTHADAMTPTTQSYLDGRDGATVFAVGGPDVNAYADSDEADESVYGGDRFETAVAVADGFFDAPADVGVARSDVFADALTGGVHIGRVGGPMLVTPSTSLQGDIEGYLCDNADSIATAYVYGGAVAISQATEEAVADRITGQGC